jgi:ABC-type multidrug transport system fused ATPase/permease subunit
MEALERLMKGRTVFMITRHLRTIRDADTIVVLDRRVAEQGRQHDLLARGRIYSDLYSAKGTTSDAEVIAWRAR